MITKSCIKTLELDKVLCLLSKKTSCEDAFELAMRINPSSDINLVSELLKETNECYSIILKFGKPSFQGLKNIEPSLNRAQMGGILSLKELLSVAKNLRCFRELTEFGKKIEKLDNGIKEKFSFIIDHRDIENTISSVVISEEEIADKASQELFSIRKEIKMLASKIRETLDKIIRSPQYQKILQEPIITIRDSRFVVPVKAEYKNDLRGIVHDASASGATLFIEPMSVVEANNKIRVLKNKEKKEIEKILWKLSGLIAESADSIRAIYKVCVELDLIFAKSSLAIEMDASLPELNQDGKINLIRARHPLIEKSKVVPIDITLGENFDSLVITGPNTGGKTVSIKTVGLLSLMAMCGLMIPALSESKVSIFKNIFVDIGDEQNIEQSLSTFSSHMINIIDITKKCDEKSLVLLDELGAGTDPIEGAALAISILEYIRERGCKILSTTHYSELKNYAISGERVENACCEFNVETLKPTYKLLIGVPGKSNAFAISEHLGISKEIINLASEFISNRSIRFEDTIKKLEEKRYHLDRDHEEIIFLKKELEKQKIKLKEEREKILKDANKKAEEIILKTEVAAEDLLNKISYIKESKPTFENIAEVKGSLRKLVSGKDLTADKDDDSAGNDKKQFFLGDRVIISGVKKEGIVLEDSGGSEKDVLVEVGSIKMRINKRDLKIIKEKPKTRHQINFKRESYGAKQEVDVRGEDVQGAIEIIDKFIDDGIINGLNILTIIHGKGTGILRREIHKHLKNHKGVKSFRLGKYGEGETGVTVVKI